MNSTYSLNGQSALVTGANSGIGKAVAIALAQNGASVVVNYVTRPEAAEEVVQKIQSSGGRAIAIEADVSNEKQVLNMYKKMYNEFGTIDILVNNAGIQKDSSFHEMSLADWKLVIDVNLTGQFLCAREAVKEFLRRGVRPEISKAAGKIICMSSVHEVIPWAGHVNYATSKGGVNLMMKSLAQEVAAHKIRVNAIGPGAIQTPINKSAWETPEALNKLLTVIPYGRIGTPEEIGKLAAWLASDESDYITGTTLFADGGMLLYPGLIENG
jgi:glucose 1-dehydrogenase